MQLTLYIALLGRQLVDLTTGPCEAMPRSDRVSQADIVSTVDYLAGEVNLKSQKLKEEVQKSNRDLLEQYAMGSASADDLLKGWQSEPLQIRSKDVKNLAKKFMKKKKWSKQTCNTSGSYLSFNDAKMVEYLGWTKFWVANCFVDGHVLYCRNALPSCFCCTILRNSLLLYCRLVLGVL